MSLHDVFHHKGLLKDGTIEHLCLDGHLDLETPRVWLCPDEASVHKLHLQALNVRGMLA